MQSPLNSTYGSVLCADCKSLIRPDRRRVYTVKPSARGRELNVRAASGKKRDLFDEYERWRKRTRLNWRLQKFAWIDQMERKKAELNKSEFMERVRRVQAHILWWLNPFIVAKRYIWVNFMDFVIKFDDYLEAEVINRWRWENRYEQEREFCLDALGYLQHLVFTVAVLVFVPASFVRGIAIPFLIGYLQYDRFWTSAQAVAVMLTLPLRFMYEQPFSFF